MRADICSGDILGKVVTRERASGHRKAPHSAGAWPDLRDAARWDMMGVRFMRSSEESVGNSRMRGIEWMAALGASRSRSVRAWTRKDWSAASTGVVAARVREGMALVWTWCRERMESSVCLRDMELKKSWLGVK